MGTNADYESITTRCDKFDGMGPEAQAFTTLIRSIIRHYSASFDAVAAGHEPTMDFWGKSCHEESLGPAHLSGRLSAFCVWDSEENGMSLEKI